MNALEAQALKNCDAVEKQRKMKEFAELKKLSIEDAKCDVSVAVQFCCSHVSVME